MKLIFKNPLAWAVLLAGASACNEQTTTEATKTPGLNLAYVDSTVHPGDDFFKFVNGNWIKNTEIPADQGRWGSFNELREYNNDVLLEVLNEATENEAYGPGSDERKAAEFYQVGMDSLRAEELGAQPLQPSMEAINSISSTEDLQAYLAESMKKGTGGMFGVWVWADQKNSSQNLALLYPGGIGLPDRDYYTKEDAKSKEIREKYVAHVANMLQMGGVADAEAKAAKIMEMETALAEAMMTKEERRDPNKTYNKKAVSELETLAPAFDWEAYFASLSDKDAIDSLNVMQPEHLKTVNEIVNSYSLEDMKAYLSWHLIDQAAPYLNHEFVQANFDFYSNYLRGVEANRPRWKRVMATANGALGEAIGKLYVAKTFPPEAKESAQEMVDNIKVAMGERIKNLEWMSDSTKERALKKLSTFVVKIGYPDKWRDYSELEVTTGENASYFQNVMNSNAFEFAYIIDQAGEPVDRSRWGMTPQTVNAYYNPSLNEIVFPAGILQPPFYNYQADAAVNYGGIGAVIGHEISHGFDDSGSQYDAEGNLKNWWSEEDSERFESRTGMLVAQYDAYEPLDSVFVSGEFTLGENIGDLGGINVAYDGLQLYLEEEGNPGLIDGLTPEQRFFMSWATIWRIKYKDETLRTQVLTDPHSPGMYRANGPLTNMKAFYEAFDVKEGNAMYKKEEDRVVIW